MVIRVTITGGTVLRDYYIRKIENHYSAVFGFDQACS